MTKSKSKNSVKDCVDAFELELYEQALEILEFLSDEDPIYQQFKCQLENIPANKFNCEALHNLLQKDLRTRFGALFFGDIYLAQHRLKKGDFGSALYLMRKAENWFAEHDTNAAMIDHIINEQFPEIIEKFGSSRVKRRLKDAVYAYQGAKKVHSDVLNRLSKIAIEKVEKQIVQMAKDIQKANSKLTTTAIARKIYKTLYLKRGRRKRAKKGQGFDWIKETLFRNGFPKTRSGIKKGRI